MKTYEFFQWSNFIKINQTIPENLQFTEANLIASILYGILIIFSAIGNVTVLMKLLKRRRLSRYSNRSFSSSKRIDILLINLTVADLLVTFLMMPLEMIWTVTVSWRSTDFMCRIMLFFRIFGLYLSSFIIICISMDRYYAILKPLSGAAKRTSLFLLIAWILSIIFSIPQSLIFHVETHPNYTWFQQCVTFNFFPSPTYEFLYTFLGMIGTFIAPFIVIVFTYTSILLKLYHQSNTSKIDKKLRRSGLGNLGKAKSKTLKMTITMVSVFLICWTPYYVMTVWYFLDRESARSLDTLVQKFLFLFACTNSCMNPIVYGFFNIHNTKLESSERHIHIAMSSTGTNLLGKKCING